MYTLLLQVILLVSVFQVKHFVADYPLQTKYMLGKFKKEGWLEPLLAHSLVHSVGTAVIVFAFTQDLYKTLCIGAFNGFIHMLMDRIKADPDMLGKYKALSPAEYMEADNIIKKNLGTPDFVAHAKRKIQSNTYFWWALGIDQMVHHLTDLMCVWAIILR